ncbi:unnamed protein product [Blepharisma stoltei]|uniref:Anaphase-promoting complex subunit 4-like WD40 domain-containing protein n=1 Tax=Blepharisma stoltei TaxID=1481888 RepID=A0AAU9K591_9CILI|nr:unnamed protein product [Blepharisma stoltei]
MKCNLICQAQINLILAKKIIKNFCKSRSLKALEKSYLNKICLNSLLQVTSYIIDLLTEDIKETLYNIVLSSRTSNFISLAASNAITILNKARFSFANKDLSRIKIPYADLSYGFITGTNFSSSNLHRVKLLKSQIYDTNFKNCDMAKADFGEKLLIAGLKANVKILAISPCGNFLAISFDCETIILYNAKTYWEIGPFIGEISPIESLSFSCNGSYLLSINRSRMIVDLWDTCSKLQISHFANSCSFSSFSPCNRYLSMVWASSDSREAIIKIYSINSKQVLNKIKGFSLSVLAFYSVTGNNLLVLEKNSLSKWDLSANKNTSQIACPYSDPVTISSDHEYIACIHTEDKISIYNTEIMEAIWTFSRKCSHSVFSPSGRYLAIEVQDYGIEILDLSIKETKYAILKNKNKLPVFSPHGKYIILGTNDKKLKSFKTTRNPEFKKKPITQKGISMISFSQDSQYFAVGTNEGFIIIFSTENQNIIKEFEAHYSGVSCICWSGNFLAVTGNDPWIKIWNIYDNFFLKIIETDYTSQSIEFSPDGKKIITWGQWGFVIIREIDTNKIIAQWSVSYNSVSICHWSPCGNYILACFSDSSIKIWRIDNQELLTEPIKHYQYYHSISISHCWNFLTTFHWDTNLKIWYLGGMKQNQVKLLKEFDPEDWIGIIEWAPSGKRIVWGEGNGKIVVWNFQKQKLVRSIAAHKGSVNILVFSANERFLISESQNIIKLWNSDMFRITE